MNAAVVFAGGVGTRMNTKSTPKQFLELFGKPIIIYTLEVFQKNPEIDAICISCLASHLDYMKELCVKFSITKVKWIVPGGATGQESIFNGLHAVYSEYPDEDTIVLVHDGVRPNIQVELVTENIKSVKEFRTAVSCAAATETPAEINDDGNIYTIYDRKKAVIAKAPQSFYLKDLYSAHLKAREEGTEFIDSASMMKHYGAVLHIVPCQWDNIKITNPSDYYIFRAILEAKENSQIFGL